ncbi:DegT/DnrJ/EryC1/StrS family aminotransferase [Phycisphaerales bacterium AB-hyl4]|uniref:DegT/DnrJ/EryC1/StrS family aminotransferase n=1 Tax=Natronomicrosphaera hydrolytica TaxID=3242702 RepID=A0ABV4U8T5_9BACT
MSIYDAKDTVDATLALDGGPKVRTTPLPVRKLFGQAERDAVVSLMDRAMSEGSHALGYGGPEEEAYCKLFAEQLGGGFADGVNSGTNAVYVALAALDLEPGSEVVVPPISDAGGAMPVAMLGCVPVAADSAPGSFNTDARQIEQVLTDRTAAILVAHIAGLPIDMAPVLELARKHKLAVVEDCAQAHGAKYQGQALGTLGDTAAFSTMFGKHHASGGQGGLVFTRREDLYWSARRRADRGKPFGLEGQHQNVVAALNCNMDELHAAIGRANVAKLPGFVAQRRRIAHRIAEGCLGLAGVSIQTERAGDEASYWFLLLKLDLARLSVDTAGFAEAVTAEGVGCAAGYPFFPARMPWASERWPMPELPNARAAEASHCRIMIHEGWTDAEADDTFAAIHKVASAYGK